MRKLFTIALGIALLALPLAVNANIDGGDHDLVNGTGTTVDVSALTNLDLCTSCHLPHNATAGADKLWAQATGAAGGVAGLCQSCHDGTVAAIAITTGSLPFTNTLHAHTAEVANCSGAETSCHDVHTQADNGTGKFLAMATPSTGQCADCHDGSFTGTNANYTLTDQFDQAQNHPQTANIGCGDCHSISVVHGTGTVVTQSGSVEATAGQWLLPVDNNAAGAWGGACVACHEDQAAPYTAVIGASSYPDGTFLNSAPAGLVGRHVTDGSGPNHSDLMTGCDDCHFVHVAGFAAATEPSTTMLQNVDNADSDACQVCHSAAGAPYFGDNSHPVDQLEGSVSLASGYPASNAINDATFDAGTDYGSTNAWIVCETCHSVHRNGTATTPFLRGNNDNDAVCSACHTAN